MESGKELRTILSAILLASLTLSPAILCSGIDFSGPILKKSDDGPIDVKLELLHRDSPSSPLYDASANRLKMFENAMQRSLDRAAIMFSRISHRRGDPDIDGRRRNGSAKEGSYFSPLTASTEGDYVTTLSLGSPPQSFATLFTDTGSTLVWVKCSNASHQNPPTNSMRARPSKTPGLTHRLFDEYASSTYANMSCATPICRQMRKDTGIRDSSCTNRSSLACTFRYTYVDRSGESGVMAYDNLNLNKVVGGVEKIEKFAFGCAVESQGISGDGGVGLDRGSYSLVTQLGSRIGHRFSYCLTSAESNSSSSIFFGKSASLEGQNAAYTPLLRPNNTGRYAYYVGVKRMYVGRRRVGVPSSVFQVRSGSGGTVMDSGTTFILLASPAYQALLLSLLTGIRYPQVFFQGSLRDVVCFDISEGRGNPDLPGLTVVLKNGAKLEIPWQNLFYRVEHNVVCMAAQESPRGVEDLSIIGNRAQQNFNFLYDLKNNQMGFVRRNCSEVN